MLVVVSYSYCNSFEFSDCYGIIITHESGTLQPHNEVETCRMSFRTEVRKLLILSGLRNGGVLFVIIQLFGEFFDGYNGKFWPFNVF